MPSATIWKYTLETPVQDYVMPRGARVLTVRVQRGVIVLWALVDADAPTEWRRFRIYGTGHLVELGASPVYLGTVQMDNLVWHVFEESIQP